MAVESKLMTLAHVIVGALILIAAPCGHAAVLSVPDQVANAGDTLVTSITLSSEGQALSGVQFDIQWDAALDVQATVGTKVGTSAKLLYTASPAPRTLRCLIIGLNQSVLSDGDLLRTFIVVSPSAGDGAAQLRLANAVGVSPDGSSVPLALSSAAIQIHTGGITQGLPPKAVLNAASLLSGPVAPGEVVTLLGSMGPGYVSDPEPVLSVNGVRAPVTYAGLNQINAIIPFSADLRGPVTLELRSQGRLVAQVSLPGAAAAPAIFSQNQSGVGPGAILNQDFTVNSFANPAAPGSILMVFGTGFGTLDRAPVDGEIATEPVPTAIPVTATIAGLPAEVTYSGSAPTLIAGITQINVRIPQEAPPNPAAPIVLNSGSAATPAGVCVSIR